MRGITKTFPGVVADDDVDFSVKPGEIHALMGENGAGKSILMSILAGLHEPDEGEIYVHGKNVNFSSPLDAINAGLGMVFQSLNLFSSLTIADNAVFHEEPSKGWLSDRRPAKRSLGVRYGR